jgi:Universal stress protein family
MTREPVRAHPRASCTNACGRSVPDRGARARPSHWRPTAPPERGATDHRRGRRSAGGFPERCAPHRRRGAGRGYGSIARAISAAAEPGTLVCMSSHGAYWPARTLTGSVTEEVLRSAQEPVLLVGPRVPPNVSLGDGCVAACLDRSPRSAQTLAPAQQWSQAFGLPLWLVQVSPPDNPDVERTRPGDVPAERRIDRLARSLAGVDGWRVLHDRRPVRALAALRRLRWLFWSWRRVVTRAGPVSSPAA